jgi:hypothetical protein
MAWHDICLVAVIKNKIMLLLLTLAVTKHIADV